MLITILALVGACSLLLLATCAFQLLRMVYNSDAGSAARATPWGLRKITLMREATITFFKPIVNLAFTLVSAFFPKRVGAALKRKPVLPAARSDKKEEQVPVLVPVLVPATTTTTAAATAAATAIVTTGTTSTTGTAGKRNIRKRGTYVRQEEK